MEPPIDNTPILEETDLARQAGKHYGERVLRRGDAKQGHCLLVEVGQKHDR